MRRIIGLAGLAAAIAPAALPMSGTVGIVAGAFVVHALQAGCGVLVGAELMRTKG